MKLRGIDFGPIFMGSGTVGFFGEGYWYHRLTKKVPGFTLEGVTFVAKTTTLLQNDGHMPLEADGITPREWKPACIKVNPIRGATLNAVGLSGPGAEWLFKQERWQKLTKPFCLSFMSLAKTKEERQKELSFFVQLAKYYMRGARSPWGLQINFSCPNVGIERDEEELIIETEEGLTIASELLVPLMPKFCVLDISPKGAARVSKHSYCDAIVGSNAFPFKKLPGKVEGWQRLFGKSSPLEHWGGGGLSGPSLFPIVKEWLHRFMLEVPRCPVNIGGGVFSKEDVGTAFVYGAHGVSIATVIMHRPWRLKGMIKEAYKRRRS